MEYFTSPERLALEQIALRIVTLKGANWHCYMQGLIKAKINNIGLSFDQSCASDLQDKYK